MKQKSMINKLKSLFFAQLVFAKQSGFEGVIMPIGGEEVIFVESSNDIEYINELADENGYDQFAFISFVKHLKDTCIL